MLKLTHIGEILIAEIITESAASRNLLFKSNNRLETINNFVVVPELRLNKYGSLIFDGTHKIDIAILDIDNKVCYPIEAKLGTNRLSKNEFNKRFITTCSTSHKNTRVKGNMISILERKLPKQIQECELSVSYNTQNYILSPSWFLICRRTVQNKWRDNGYPDLSDLCTVISFEDIAKLYGDEIKFNALISRLLQTNYYSNWVS